VINLSIIKQTNLNNEENDATNLNNQENEMTNDSASSDNDATVSTQTDIVSFETMNTSRQARF
jgi:hypothetical protein